MTKRLKSSGLWTGQEEFQNFRIVEMPTRGFIDAKITRLPHEKTILIQISETEYCLAHQIVNSGWAFPLSFSSWPWQKTLVNALAQLGAISKETHKDVLRREKKLAEINERKHLVRSFKDSAKKIGIELTDEQISKLAA